MTALPNANAPSAPRSASARPRIVVSQPVHPAVQARLAAAGDLQMNPGPEPWEPAQLQARLAQAEAWMAFMTDAADAATLQAAPRLRIIAGALKGADSFDARACAEAGVWLSVVPDLLSAPTAELAIALALAAGRHVLDGDRQVRSGGFHGWRPRLYGRGLAGATVAVLGLGRLGQAIVQRLQGFDCARLLGVDPTRQLPGVEACTLAQALAQAELCLIALPLAAGTRGLLGEAALAVARPGQTWVNVGRGSVVDEAAVLRALQSGRLAAYAADVFAFEDWALPDRPPEILPPLREHPRTVWTPHLGSAVADVRLAIEHAAADNLLAVLAGGPPPDAVNAPQPPRG